mmetsp:Transcript_81136/g.178255  ORF Transcript_81136/g.178255 Transcript_81136/m.178255 type:complete len:84 (+) Transcript_81136:763-1014(+)
MEEEEEDVVEANLREEEDENEEEEKEEEEGQEVAAAAVAATERPEGRGAARVLKQVSEGPRSEIFDLFLLPRSSRQCPRPTHL